MKLSRAELILRANILAGHNTLLVGAPGVGKTDVYTKIAADEGMELVVMHPVVADPTDFKGLPWVNQGSDEARFLPFGDLAKLCKTTKKTLVLLDDIGQAPPAVQAAVMQLLLKREIDGHKISDKVVFAAATNRREDRAGVSGILEPVKSRFATILHVEPDLESWLDWALQSGIEESICAFLRYRPEMLHQFSPTANITNSASPRTWASLDKQVKLGLPREAELHAYSGSVGEGAAVEYTGFKRCYTELPEWDEILNSPDVARIPATPSALYAVATSIAFQVDRKTFKDVIIYINRMPEEFGVLTIRDAVRKDPKIVNSPAWVAFLQSGLGKLCTGND